MEKLLNKTEGTEEAADQSAKKYAVKKNNSEDVVGSSLLRCAKRVLKRAERTRPRRSGAGIAVKTGCANVLDCTLINFSVSEALKVSVKQQSRIKLNKLALSRQNALDFIYNFTHIIILSLYIRCKFLLPC